MSEARFEVKIATVLDKYPGESGSDTLTFDHSDEPKKVIDYALILNENYPSELTILFENRDGGLIGSTYDADAGEGDLVLGLEVYFYLYPTLTDTKTQVFHGKIVTIKQTPDNNLEISCGCPLYSLDTKIFDTYYANTYSEEIDVAVAILPEPWPAVLSTGDAWVEPPLSVSLCVTEEYVSHAPNSDANDEVNLTADDHYLQQTIPRKTSHISNFYVQVGGGASNTATMWIGLFECDTAGNATGSVIAYMTVGPHTSKWFVITGYPDETTSFTSIMNYAKRFSTGKNYCFVFYPIGNTTVVDLYIRIADPSTYTPKAKLTTDGGTNWAEQTYSVAPLAISYSPWEDIDTKNCYRLWGGSTDIYISGYGRDDIPYTTSDAKTGMATYFKNTVTKKVVLENLINLVYLITQDRVDTNISSTFGIYRTMGKSALQCIRQICELAETGLSNRQLVCYSALYGNVPQIMIRGRYNTDDSSVATFSDAIGTMASRRIIDANLIKTAVNRINSVIVVGDRKGTPIYASAVDHVDKDVNGETTHKVVNKNLATYAECVQEARRIRDTINRSGWGGDITVSGCYPDLIDVSYNDSGDTAGGEIVTLNISPLNISSTKFKVKTVSVFPGKTMISLTDYDYTKESVLEANQQRLKYTESFVASPDIAKEFFISVRSETTQTAGDRYCELQRSGGTPISGQTRVKCTKTTDGDFTIYHAEFEPGNGYSDGYLVEEIKLYDAVSGGNLKHSGLVGPAEYFFKFKSTRVSVDFIVDTS